MEQEKHISFLDEHNNTISMWVNIIEETTTYVKFSTKTNTLTIPMHRVLKIKERGTTNE